MDGAVMMSLTGARFRPPCGAEPASHVQLRRVSRGAMVMLRGLCGGDQFSSPLASG